MILEIIITGIILSVSVYFLFKNFKNKAQGKCDCSNCSSRCIYYKEKKEKKENKEK